MKSSMIFEQSQGENVQQIIIINLPQKNPGVKRVKSCPFFEDFSDFFFFLSKAELGQNFTLFTPCFFPYFVQRPLMNFILLTILTFLSQKSK